MYIPKVLFRIRCRIFLCLAIGVSSMSVATAQSTDLSYSGWLYWDNTVSISNRLALRSDIHLRSTNDFTGIGNVLARLYLDYSATSRGYVGAGYTYLASWDEDTAFPNVYYGENRLFQQVAYDVMDKDVSQMQVRMRLEQRFFNTPLLPPFSLRSRLSLNWKRNLSSASQDPTYLQLENEVFVNMRGQQLSGHRAFEQNRFYAGIGFPFLGLQEFELGSYYEIQHDVFQQRNQRIMIQVRFKSSM